MLGQLQIFGETLQQHGTCFLTSPSLVLSAFRQQLPCVLRDVPSF